MAVYILLCLASFLLGLFVKDFLPNYMKKKGENLATKQDIAEITQKTEEVKQQFQRDFTAFSNMLKFRNEYTSEQYINLYAKLYAIVVQSEYCRKYMQDIQGISTSFDEHPYLEISPTRKQTTTFGNGTVQGREEIIETDISQTNKRKLFELVIDNSQYASQELLKIAVAYRFIHSMHGPTASDEVNEEEIRLLKKLLLCIIKEYNGVRKLLQFDYNDEELSNGLMVEQF
ncbi:hypothetical protein LJC61_05740 [Ruminococcaceae bacterium OttesenSCG-928-A16]|nr:hypothetical protein [Ruminococcaceae bacterium OttesenSCG-928-A16]